MDANDRTILETKSNVKESKTELTEQLYCFGKNNSGESVGDKRAREYCVSCRTTEHTTSGTTPGKNTWHIAWHGSTHKKCPYNVQGSLSQPKQHNRHTHTRANHFIPSTTTIKIRQVLHHTSRSPSHRH